MALRCLDRTCSHSFLTLVFKDPQGKPQETEAGYALGQEKCLRKEPLFKSFLFFIFYPVMRLYNSVSLSPDGESLPLRFCSCLWGLFFKAHQRAPSQVFCTGSSEEPLLTSDQKSVPSFPPRNWCGRWHSATLLPLLGPVAHSVFFCLTWREWCRCPVSGWAFNNSHPFDSYKSVLTAAHWRRKLPWSAYFKISVFKVMVLKDKTFKKWLVREDRALVN